MRSGFLVLALAVSVSAAHALECPVPPGASASLGAVDAEARLHFLQRGMRHAAHKARIWAWSSAGVLVAVGSFQFMGAIKVPDRGDRIDLWVGAASLGLSLVQMAAVPPLVTIDQWTLDRKVRRAGPNADRCALLAEGERLLVRDARSEEMGTGLAMHAITVFLNIGAGVVLGLGFNRWTSAATSIFVGAGLGELQILTQPIESVKLLERYRAGDLTPKKADGTAFNWTLVPTVTRDHFGLSLAVSY